MTPTSLILYTDMSMSMKTSTAAKVNIKLPKKIMTMIIKRMTKKLKMVKRPAVKKMSL